MNRKIDYVPYAPGTSTAKKYEPVLASSESNVRFAKLAGRVYAGEIPRVILDAESLDYAFKDPEFLARQAPIKLDEPPPTEDPSEVYANLRQSAKRSGGDFLPLRDRSSGFVDMITLADCSRYRARATRIIARNISVSHGLLDMLLACRRLHAAAPTEQSTGWGFKITDALAGWGVGYIPREKHQGPIRDHLTYVSGAWLSLGWRQSHGAVVSVSGELEGIGL